MASLQRITLPVARAAARTFYRLGISGASVPEGPVIVVANHPNMAADAAVLVTAAGRSARFLAKSTLFDIPVAGALLRAIGTIPIYRRQDDPDQVSRNEDSFAAVVEALEAGDVVGIFPEGISHDEPSIAPLRTGTARIGLMAAERGVFPSIIPMGLTYGAKETFRSTALALIGSPVGWEDLRDANPSDRAAVQELTARIDEALRGVTVNVEQQRDRFVVTVAERIHAAEFDRGRPPHEKIVRQAAVAAELQRARAEMRVEVEPLYSRIESFGRLLERLHLSPSALDLQTRSSVAARWLLRSAVPLALSTPLYIIGRFVLLPPYLMTHLFTRRASPVTKATAKILVGLVLYLLYGTGIGVAVGMVTSPARGAFTALLYVLIALLTLWLSGRVTRGRRDLRRFFLLRSNRSFHRQLLDQRTELAGELAAIRSGGGPGGPPIMSSR